MKQPPDVMHKIVKALQRIQKNTGPFKKSPFALGNLLRDLEAICLRMQSGEYKDTNFLERNIFDIPRRTREFFNYLQGYHLQAETWAELLRKLPLARIKTIIDLCPGWAPKIEMALHYLSYTGEVILFDQNQGASQNILDFMKLFQPHYSLRKVNGELFHAQRKLKTSLLIGNHIFDDILLDRYCRTHNLALDAVYESEHLYKEVVDQLLRSVLEYEDDLVENLSRSIDAFLHRNGYLILTQYPSLAEKSLGLKAWSQLCQKIMIRVKKTLLSRNYTDIGTKLSQSVDGLSKKYFSGQNVVALKKQIRRTA